MVAIAVVGSKVAARCQAARSIPDDRRAVIFGRALDDLKQSCSDRPHGALADHCRELASFLARFDECRGECEALVRAQLTPIPTR